MIPMMSCPARDLGQYYNGCVLFDAEHKPWLVMDCNSQGIIVQDRRGASTVLQRKQLFVHYLTPFYDADGTLHGVQVNRSYKRAPVYEMSVFKDLSALMKGEFKSTFDGVRGRVGKCFYCDRDLRLGSIVQYYNEPCGFFKDGTFFIPDEFLAERLRLILTEEGSQYVVQTV